MGIPISPWSQAFIHAFFLFNICIFFITGKGEDIYVCFLAMYMCFMDCLFISFIHFSVRLPIFLTTYKNFNFFF